MKEGELKQRERVFLEKVAAAQKNVDVDMVIEAIALGTELGQAGLLTELVDDKITNANIEREMRGVPYPIVVRHYLTKFLAKSVGSFASEEIGSGFDPQVVKDVLLVSAILASFPKRAKVG